MSNFGKWAGYFSLSLILFAWLSFWIPWPPDWFPNVYLIADIGAGVAGVSGVIAGLKDSKLWYYSAFLGFATCMFLLAGAAV